MYESLYKALLSSHIEYTSTYQLYLLASRSGSISLLLIREQCLPCNMQSLNRHPPLLNDFYVGEECMHDIIMINIRQYRIILCNRIHKFQTGTMQCSAIKKPWQLYWFLKLFGIKPCCLILFHILNQMAIRTLSMWFIVVQCSHTLFNNIRSVKCPSRAAFDCIL